MLRAVISTFRRYASIFLKLIRTHRLAVYVGSAVFVILVICMVGVQNFRADASLGTSQKADNSGHYTLAKNDLTSISQFAVLPKIRARIHTEQQRNRQLIATELKLQEVQKLLKENKPQAAESLLKSIGSATNNTPSLNTQVAALQKTAQTQTTKSTTKTQASSGSSTSSSSSSSSGTGTNGGGASTSGGGGSGGTPTPPAPSPMSAITINSFSPSVSPRNATTCSLYESVNFSVNGSGSVTVTWEQLSAKTSSSIDNAVTYSFTAAGSQVDTPGNTVMQGLESGDSYRISVVITDTSNNAVTATAGPVTFSSCAAAQPLQSPGQASFMSSSVSPTSLTASQSQDTLFPNECSMNLQSAFTVGGPGSVQVVYTITSSFSIGATLYSSQQEDSTGPSAESDSSYIRMPHLPGGGSYSVTATFNVLGDPSHNATTGPVTVACD
jgi:hypothetical protein